MEYVADVEDALGLPDPDHVDLVVQGLIDTVDGHESYGLSSAQEYLQATLVSAGVFRAQEVAGNEGFVGAIADGVKKAWEYIVNLFKSIYNAVFKKKVKDQEVAVKADIKETESALQQVDTPKVNKENLKKHWDRCQARVKKMRDGPEKTKVAKDIEEGQKGTEDAQVQSVKKVIKEVFACDLGNYAGFVMFDRNLELIVGRLNEIKDEYAKTEDLHDLDGSIQTYLNGLNGLPTAQSIKDVASAKAFLNKLARCNEAMGNSWMTIFNTQQVIQRRIDETEKKINNFSKDEGNDKIRKDLKALQTHLKGVQRLEQLNSHMLNNFSRITDGVKRAIITVEE